MLVWLRTLWHIWRVRVEWERQLAMRDEEIDNLRRLLMTAQDGLGAMSWRWRRQGATDKLRAEALRQPE